MRKFRAVLMVPSVVEFENPGGDEKVTAQVKRIAEGLGKAKTMHPGQEGAVYAPKVLECVEVPNTPTPLILAKEMKKAP